MSNDIQASRQSGDLVINAKAKKGIDIVFGAMKDSHKKTVATDAAESVPQKLMQGICIALTEGVLPNAVLREISGRQNGTSIMSGMWKSDKAAFAAVCEAVQMDMIIPHGDGTSNIRALMVGKDKKSKGADGAITVKTTWPSMQGLYGKILKAKEQARLSSDDATVKKAALAEQKTKKANADIKAADSAVKHFGALANAVKAICHAVKSADDSAKLDKEKAAVLNYVAGLNPKQITALIAEFKIK